MRTYSNVQTAIANVPYALMVLSGAATIAWSFHLAAGAVAGAVAYALYGIGGTLWVMVFICPYCAYYETRGCPCGYGTIAARLAPKGDRECFAAKFRRHIGVIFPLWIVPAVCGGTALWRGGAHGALPALLAVFAVDAFVILPLVSRRHSCAECPQKDTCPWMGRKRAARTSA